MSAPQALRSRAQRGSTLVGFVLGLIAGLAIAVIVALFVTRAPIPFANKVGRAPDTPVKGPEPGTRLPDPNRPLYPKDANKAEELGAQGSALPASPGGTAGTPAPAPDTRGGAPVVEKSVPATATATPDSGEIRQTFLQAGAFKSPDEADNMKAKLALLGLEARVSPVERAGTTLYRVRVGPYARAEDLNRVRDRLTENGITLTQVPVGQ